MFDQLFSVENPVLRAISRMVDLVWLNILTLIGCIPIITAGASFAAMYSVLLKMVRNEEGYVTKGYLKGFKENFGKATKVWILALIIGTIGAINLYLISQGIMSEFGILGEVVVTVVVFAVLAQLIWLMYILALIARYENTLGATIKNAVLLSIANLPRSICILVIFFSPVALMTLHNAFIIFWFLYGFAFPGYANAILFRAVFDKLERQQSSEAAS